MSDIDTAERAANILLGLKEYDVYARETVYSLKRVWALNEDDAEKVAHDEGFTNEDIIDGADFEITEVEEIAEDE